MTFFDTAEVYGPFTNEELVGEALAAVRDRVVIATKFGFDVRRRRPQAGRRQPTRARSAQRRGLAAAAAHRPIDLLYQHRVDPDVPIEDVAGTVKELIDAGQGRHFGLSEAGADDPPRTRGAAGHGAAELSTRSGGASRRTRSCRRCEELGIGFVPFSPLGRGFLTGKIDETPTFESADFRNTIPRFTDRRHAQANQAFVDLLARIAERKGRDAGADRARLAARAEAVDRADPRHDASSHRLEENIAAPTSS